MDADAVGRRRPSDHAKRILIVGGNSRSARAFRRRAYTDPTLEITTLVRQIPDSTGREVIVQVSDYFAPPDSVFQGVDAIVNFAAMTGKATSDLLFEINARGPTRLAEKAKRAGVPHFIQLSSLHVYGYAEEISHDTVEAPVAAYGRAKQAGDSALIALAKEDFNVTILRLPILYGGGTGDNFRRLAYLMSMIGYFPVGMSPCFRSALHVDNLACVLLATLRHRPSGICFAADDQPFTLDALADAIGAGGRKRTKLISFPDAIFLPLRFMARGLYSRLFRPNLVRADACLKPDEPFPVKLRDGLKEILPQY